ncbi:MAG: hypothetical protein HQM10_12295 [Candidatus Riflebacteria bacterium]|nr:hypothetical protein [Candidatus Riflebacteria bacterium]
MTGEEILGSKAEVNYQYFEDVLFEKRIWMPSANISNYLLMFTAPYLGSRDKHGRRSFKDFLTATSESEVVPRTIVFWNRSVIACFEGSPILPALSRLDKSGVKILVSAQAINRMKAMDRLVTGKLANYTDLLDAMHKSQKIITF